MRPREPKVTDLDSAVGIDQQVRWLDVSVHNVGRVHEVEGAQQAVDDLHHVILRELQLGHRLEDLLQVGLHELHNDEDVAQIVRALGSDDVVNLGRVAVALHLAQLAKNLNLSEDLLGVVLILENVFD